LSKKISLTIFLLLISAITTEINSQDLIIGSNFRVYPSSLNQSETFIVTHPNNPDILFASAYTIQVNPFFISEGVYVSTNSGQNWHGTDTCYGAPINFHGGEPGIAIDKDGTFILNRLGRQPTFIGLYSHYSTDNGDTWSNQLTITTDDLEKHSVASDVFSSSSFYGRTYAAYTMLTSPYTVKGSYTDDGGQSWVPVFAINSPPQRCFGTDITIKNNGEVLVCWAVMSSPPSPYEINIGFAKSSSGGTVWNVQENPIITRGITGVLDQKQNIRVNSSPRIAVDNTNSPYSGNIYIVTSQKELAPAGNDPDIVLFRSTDNGNTWSSGIRVNQDPLNNGKIQFFPAVHIDPLGGINVLYLDDRNTTSDSSGIFLSRSLDGGDTWIDYEISDHNFRPVAVSGLGAGNVSDHIDLTYTNGKLWPAWMDNSTGIYQLWTAPITITALDAADELHPVTDFVLRQNYPNPFNPGTSIQYTIGSMQFVTLKVYDVLGREVATLVNEEKPAGSYEVNFSAGSFGDASGLSSGIYFYRLSTEHYSETKSMMLLK
jgi:hypothetical protein